jgi:hypothetical protein
LHASCSSLPQSYGTSFQGGPGGTYVINQQHALVNRPTISATKGAFHVLLPLLSIEIDLGCRGAMPNQDILINGQID